MAIEREADDAGRESAIVIRDRRKPNQYTTDNLIAREWLPILRIGDAFFFYSVYLSMANRRTESSWGSLRTMAQYLQCGIDLIIRGNKLLEICELIYIEPGNQHTTNEYYILDPPALEETLIARINSRLDEIEEQEKSKNWLSWIKQIRKALARHQSLPDIWATRRANRGGRPIRTRESEKNPVVSGYEEHAGHSSALARQEAVDQESLTSTFPSQKGTCEPQAGFSSKSACGSQAGYTWPTSRDHVSHKRGGCEPQTEQEQLRKETNKSGKEERATSPDLLLFRQKCLSLGVTPPVLDVLVERYPLEHLQQQLDWLSARTPRDPPAMFVRAVQENWSAPAQYAKTEVQEREQTNMMAADDTETEAEEEPDSGTRVKQGHARSAVMSLENKDITAQRVWANALRELEMQMTRATFDTWLRDTQAVNMYESDIVVQVRDSYTAEWLRSRLHAPIQRTVEGIVGRTLDVVYELR